MYQESSLPPLLLIPPLHIFYKSISVYLQGILQPMMEIHCVVSGLVQQVSYRTYVQDSATLLGICGWVENLPDGTVEVLAQGEKDLLNDFVEYLHEGSLKAKVESVAVDWQTPKVIYDDFSVKF